MLAHVTGRGAVSGDPQQAHQADHAAVAVEVDLIVGLKDYIAQVKAEDAKLTATLPPTQRDKPFLDLRRWPLPSRPALASLH